MGVRAIGEALGRHPGPGQKKAWRVARPDYGEEKSQEKKN